MTQQLSPAAQAILDAAEAGLDGYIEPLPPTWKSSVSAALRAAALYCKRDRLQLLAIAEELDGL